MMKAGLALAYEGRGLQDSVLTLDDIIGLRLNADWVVLSACNTGFARGSAGDALSALVPGFFAAGARTLLVSMWAVDSDSAKDLTVATFKRQVGGAPGGQPLAGVQRERCLQARWARCTGIRTSGALGNWRATLDRDPVVAWPGRGARVCARGRQPLDDHLASPRPVPAVRPVRHLARHEDVAL
jgi:hypothetical protein